MTALMLALLVAAVVPAPGLFDRDGYRAARYRAPVSAPPEGVPAVSTVEAARLFDRNGAIFIDVMPAEGGRRDPATGRWQLAEERHSLPGAYWFPESGRAPLDPAIAVTFRSGIAALRRSQPGKPLLVFCRADCWMSWNAARRLSAWGFRDVRWFGEGTDGWSELGRPLVPLRPHEETLRP